MRTKDNELRGLLARIERRDEHAMGDFYNFTKPFLISYIRRIVRDFTTAEEVFQDTLCHIWLNASSYRAERSALVAWVYLIARSRAVDALRRDRRIPFMQPLEDYASGISAKGGEAEQMMRWHESQLWSYVTELPAAQRQLIHLAFFEGFSHAEIAVALKLPLGTVKSRIRVVLHKLRDGLASCCDGSRDTGASFKESLFN